MLALEVIEGADRGRRFPLPPGEPQLIGRSSEAIPLSDTSVSRRHAELTPRDDTWLIRDLESTNGTDVNGHEVAQLTGVSTGDVIRCGQTRLRVIEVDELIAGPAATLNRPLPPPPTLPDDPEACRQALDLVWRTAHRGTDEAIEIQPLLDAEGSQPEPPGVELARWVQQILQKADQAQNQDRLAAMGETVAIVSHAVKNILQGLQGGAGAIELALAKGDLDLARQGWPILARNLDRIHDLTFNMLAWSRTHHLDIEPQPLQPLIDDIVELQQPICKTRRITLSTRGENLEAVPFDSGAIHQALLNLVVNAIEAAPPRRGTVQIVTGRSDDMLEAVITVIDDGPGIPVAVQEEIFEPFASSRGQRGTGLGLAVTRRIAEAHGGSVALRSAQGQGATFEIRLPLHAAHEDPGKTDVPPLAEPDHQAFEP